MTTTLVDNVVLTALSDFERTLEMAGAGAAILTLCRQLAVERSTYAADAWRTACARAGDHPAFAVLLQDPYLRDARTKPSGYAGDARLLDYIYRQEFGPQEISPLGEEMFEVTTDVPLAGAVRDRCRRLGGMVAALGAAQPGARVISLACGHARELDLLPASAVRRVRYWGLDQDEVSLATAQARHPDATFEAGSVRAVIQGTRRLPTADLVYASGLFDYLNDRVAPVLLKRMWAAVRPGGSLMVPNLTPGSDEIPFMEAIMDWWMEYRDEAAMQRLAREVKFPGARQVDTYTTCNGMVAWLVVERSND